MRSDPQQAKTPAAEAPAVTASVADVVQYLSSPEAYAHHPARVEVVETHWSWVFLAGDRVYKLKKPVTSEHFDFTSLAARETNCRSEVRLNRRLAGDVYLGVSRVVLGPGSRLSIDGEGGTIDWVVVMRRLPADSMLDQLIAGGSFGPPDLERLGVRLASFYSAQPPSNIAPDAYLGRFLREQATNRKVLAACPVEISSPYLGLLDRGDAMLAKKISLLDERVRAGRILDGHGDLRPEHVCMADSIVIFDCLEFSDKLRQVDPVDELAFLGLECDVLGAGWIGPKLMATVMARLRQTAPEELVALHTACRAMLRTRLTLAHLLDPVPRTPEKWRPRAERYSAAADNALASLGF